jgi:rubrerythrin
MTGYECFQGAARLETLAQGMYAGLARTFVGHPRLRHLFARLSAEEGQHAMRIWLLCRHQGDPPWPADAMARISAGLEGMAKEVESMTAELAEPGQAPDAGEILRRVADVARRLGSIHADELARSDDPEVQRLFWSLAQQDARHQGLIEGERAKGERPVPARG